MIVPKRNIGIFVIVSSAIIAMLVAVPAPIDDTDGMSDDALGVRVAGSARIVQAARQTGDARRALEVLQAAPPEHALSRSIRTSIKRLEAELGPLTPPSPNAPELLELADPELEKARCISLLAALADDRASGVTEAFFADVPGADPDGVDRRALLAEPTVESAITVVDDFERTARPRAQLRWLLRGFDAHPEASPIAMRLAAFFVARGRLTEALAVAREHAKTAPDDVAFWARYAEIARWMSKPEIEFGALEQLVARRDDAAARRRLLDLCAVLRDPERGFEHARALAAQAVALDDLEAAVAVAFERGAARQAMPLMERLAATSTEPVRWHQLLVEHALHDLDIDLAVEHLEYLVHLEPDGGHDADLGALYRRRAMLDELADLLEWRWARNPTTADHGELLALLCALDQRRRARALATGEQRPDPRRFTLRIDPADRAQLEATRSLAVELAQSGPSAGNSVADVIDSLRPYLDRPGVREIAETLLARYPDGPEAKKLRIELIDVGRSGVAAAKAAEDVALRYPNDPGPLRTWIDRAAWAGLAADEERARLLLLEVAPDDDDNRLRLIDLLQARGAWNAAAIQLEHLVEKHGLGSAASAELIDCLFAAGRFDDAAKWLSRLANDPSATWEDRMRAAEELFFRSAYDQSQALFAAVLDERPDQPKALLRLGQILAWTKQPRAAIPLLERRLLVDPTDRGAVGYELGQAYWAIDETDRAREVHAEALAILESLPDPTVESKTMAASIVARLGRADEAIKRFRALVEDSPENTDLVLDYVGVLAAADQLDEADRMVEHARRVAPEHPRLTRAESQLAIRRGDWARAADALRRGIELNGPDADSYADLSFALEQDGAWDDALDATRRWLALRSNSEDARARESRLTDSVATFALGALDWRGVGDDRSLEAGIAASLRPGDESRLEAQLGFGDYSGRAAAVGGGTVDLTSTANWIDLAWQRRFDRSQRFRLGLHVADTDVDQLVGGYAGLFLASDEPYRAIEVRLFGNELWTDPPAAVALSGRAHGVELYGYGNLGQRLWASGSARFRSLEVEVPGTGPTSDEHLSAELALGYQFGGASVAVIDRFRMRRTPSGPTSPWLTDDEDESRWFVNAWASLSTYRLVGDGNLDLVLPIANRADYLLAAVRVDRQIAQRLGASIEGYAGYELDQGAGIWGIDIAATWRPSTFGELSLRAGRGDALSRAGDVSHHVSAQLILRW